MIEFSMGEALLRLMELGSRLTAYLQIGEVSGNVFIDKEDAKRLVKFICDEFGWGVDFGDGRPTPE